MRRALALLLAAGCLLAAAPASAETIWAVGDAQSRDVNVQNQVAARMQAEGPFDRLLFLGDFSNGGTLAEYRNLYGPSYGRFRSITYPTPGNHGFGNVEEGYDAYWGSGFRQPNGGHYYSVDIGPWHFVSLNSEEPLDRGSPQYNWLQNDLAQRKGTCTMAFLHRPRYSAGPQWSTLRLEPAWQALRGHASVVLSGHAHNYQRHHPNRGITQFVVGTGGGAFGNTDNYDPRLAASRDNTTGALRMRLGVGKADYEFFTPSGAVLDGGTIECVSHVRAPARVKVTRPRNRATYRAFRTFGARLRNTRKVRVSLLRKADRRCSVYDGKGFRGSSCASKRSVAAKLNKARSRLRFKSVESLPEGAYRLTVLARSVDGSLVRKVTRFKVRAPGSRQ